MQPAKAAGKVQQNQQAKKAATTNLPKTRDSAKFLQEIPTNPREWRVGRVRAIEKDL